MYLDLNFTLFYFNINVNFRGNATRESVFKECMKAVVVIGAAVAGTIAISLTGVDDCR